MTAGKGWVSPPGCPRKARRGSRSRPAELLNLEPGLRQHVSDLVIGDLKGEVLRDDTDFAYAVHNLIVGIETKWRNDG